MALIPALSPVLGRVVLVLVLVGQPQASPVIGLALAAPTVLDLRRAQGGAEVEGLHAAARLPLPTAASRLAITAVESAAPLPHAAMPPFAPSTALAQAC